MATIGTFTSTENGFTGSIRTLALNVKACIARVENPSDKGPQFRVYAGSVELARPGRRPPSKAAPISRSSLTIRASRLRSTQRSPKSKAKMASSSSGPARTGIDEDHGLRLGRSLSPIENGGLRLAHVEPGEHLAQLRVLLDELLCKLTSQRIDFRIEVGHFVDE